jgi:hypothetical protein
LDAGEIVLKSAFPVLTQPFMKLACGQRLIGSTVAAAFARGYRLDKEAADLVPAVAIGRMLDPVESGELFTRLAENTKKRRRLLVKLG